MEIIHANASVSKDILDRLERFVALGVFMLYYICWIRTNLTHFNDLFYCIFVLLYKYSNLLPYVQINYIIFFFTNTVFDKAINWKPKNNALGSISVPTV